MQVDIIIVNAMIMTDYLQKSAICSGCVLLGLLSNSDIENGDIGNSQASKCSEFSITGINLPSLSKNSGQLRTGTS